MLQDEAEELVREVFIEIWNKARTYERDEGTVSIWIIKIASRHYIAKLSQRRAKKLNINNHEC